MDRIVHAEIDEGQVLMPGDLAGAARIYCEARRKYERSWDGESRIRSLHIAGLREQNAAATAVLTIIERHFGGEAGR